MQKKARRSKQYRTEAKALLACQHYNATRSNLFYRVRKVKDYRLWEIVVTDFNGNQSFLK
jgi:hypothetical protein